MTRSRRSASILTTACALALLALLPRELASQARAGDVQVVATILNVDAANYRLRVSLLGEPRPVAVASDARILDAEGRPLDGGLQAPELPPGAEVTLTLSQVDGVLTVTALRLGRHVAEQRMLRGPTIGLQPLTELGADARYAGEDGGLYGAGRNAPPAAHLAAAEAATAAIRRRDATGQPAEDGAIGLISISMSNATMEFSTFKEMADQDPRKSSRVVIVDCAQGGQAMAQWVDPEGSPWLEADRRLAAANVSPAQVQVAWIKLANIAPAGDLQAHGGKLYEDTRLVLQNARRRFPNLRIAYLGSRIFAGYATGGLNPEPYAYEGAFVIRWLIRDQMNGAAGLRHDSDAGPMPLLLWGPYLWADGMTPRQSDGLIWERSDLAADGTHPAEGGRRKVAGLLLAFFTTDQLAKTWFTTARREP
jgi:hypothetical protein